MFLTRLRCAFGEVCASGLDGSCWFVDCASVVVGLSFVVCCLFGPFLFLGRFWSCNNWKYSEVGSSSAPSKIPVSFSPERTAESSSGDSSASEDGLEESEPSDKKSESDESEEFCVMLCSLPLAAVKCTSGMFSVFLQLMELV